MVGFDKFNLNHDLELYLPFEEQSGVLAYSRCVNDIVTTLQAGITWGQLAASGQQYVLLDRTNPDWLDAPAADTVILNFTTSDFSMAIWVNADLTADVHLMARGAANTDGWLFGPVDTNGRVYFATCQAGLTQTTVSYGDIVANEWFLIGVSRTGEYVKIYINGEDRTDAPDTHVDPLTSARELHIGILDDETTDPFDGLLANPRIWSRVLSQMEWWQLYNMERERFQ